MTRVLVVLMLVLGGAAVAHAEDAATRTAKRHFERGEKLFAVGQFSDALEEYKKAYEAKPLPGFLYNVGQCYRNLGDLDQAIFSYKKYLQLMPEAKNREQVEKLIDELEQKKADADAAAQAAAAAKQHETDDTTDAHGTTTTAISKRAPPPATASPFYTKWWFWTGVVVIGAAGGVGIFEATHSGAPATDLGPPLNFHQ